MSLPSLPLAALLAIALSLCLPPPAAAQTDVRIGVLDFLGAEATEGEWSPLVHHLERSLPGHQVSLLQLDHARMRAAVNAGELDFIITNPGHYVEFDAELSASRILTLDDGGGRSPERALGSAGIVRICVLENLGAAAADFRVLAQRRSGARSPGCRGAGR